MASLYFFPIFPLPHSSSAFSAFWHPRSVCFLPSPRAQATPTVGLLESTICETCFGPSSDDTQCYAQRFCNCTCIGCCANAPPMLSVKTGRGVAVRAHQGTQRASSLRRPCRPWRRRQWWGPAAALTAERAPRWAGRPVRHRTAVQGVVNPRGGQGLGCDIQYQRLAAMVAAATCVPRHWPRPRVSRSAECSGLEWFRSFIRTHAQCNMIEIYPRFAPCLRNKNKQPCRRDAVTAHRTTRRAAAEGRSL